MYKRRNKIRELSARVVHMLVTTRGGNRHELINEWSEERGDNFQKVLRGI
jgi:hypothetical protein